MERIAFAAIGGMSLAGAVFQVLTNSASDNQEPFARGDVTLRLLPSISMNPFLDRWHAEVGSFCKNRERGGS